MRNKEKNGSKNMFSKAVPHKTRKDWLMVQLGDITQVVSGQSPKSKYYNVNQNGLPFYQGKTEFKKIYLGKPVKWTTSITKVANPDDILMSVRAPVGPVNITQQKICIGRGLSSIRAKEVNHLFIFYYLRKNESKITGHGGSVFNSINQKSIKKIKTPLAPFPEQKAIVQKIEVLLKLIDKSVKDLESAKEKLKVYRQVVLKKAFEGKLNSKWKSKSYFSKWNQKKLFEFALVLTGNTPSKKNKKFYYKREYPFYKPSDLEAGSMVTQSIDGLSKEGFKSCRKAPANSILVTCIGTIGKTGLIIKEGGFNQQINALIPNKKINSKFIYYQAISPRFQNAIKRNASSTVLPILNKEKFQNLEMFICSEIEQKAIVKKIEDIFSHCDKTENAIEQNLKNIDSLKQSILKKAFIGKLLNEKELEKCRKSPDWKSAKELLSQIQKEKSAIKQKTSKFRKKRKAV